MTFVVGMIGYSNAGKSTLANEAYEYLNTNNLKSRVMGFSEPIYDMLGCLGVSRAIIDNKQAREEPHPALMGESPLMAMISLGTNWGRECVHPDLWMNAVKLRIEADEHNDVIFLENVRFPNEMDMVYDMGGTCVYVNRAGLTAYTDRVSESHIARMSVHCDHWIENDFENLSGTAKKLAIAVMKSMGLDTD